MIRKAPALFLMALMTLVITLKYSVLGYCLCLGAFSGNECRCHTATSEVSVKDSSTDCCGGKKEACSETSSETCKNHCLKQLAIDVGDFVWDKEDFKPSPSELEFHQPPFLEETNIASHSLKALCSAPARGSPPPDLPKGSLPLFLSQQVLKL